MSGRTIPAVRYIETGASRRKKKEKKFHAGLARSREHGLLVVDDEPEVALSVLRRGGALHQREELVAQVDEGDAGTPPPQLELEQGAVEGERLVERGDLERHVIDPDGAAQGTQSTRRV